MSAAYYQIFQTIGGIIVETEPQDIFAWAEMGGRKIGITYKPHLREELREAPTIQGLCGPMWGGYAADGIAIVRYEDQATCDYLSK